MNLVFTDLGESVRIQDLDGEFDRIVGKGETYIDLRDERLAIYFNSGQRIIASVALADVSTPSESTIEALYLALGSIFESSENYISVLNSSTAPLAGGAKFTGPSEDITIGDSIFITVKTDADSVANGLAVEFSPDGTNWDRAKEYSVFANTSAVHGLRAINQFVRVVYENSATPQSFFRLQVVIGKGEPFIASSTREGISDENDVQLIRTTNDHLLDLSRGLYQDHQIRRKFGKNTAVGTPASGPHYITTQGGAYNFLTAADTIRIKAGGDAQDRQNGTGARSFLVKGLDENWDEVEETILPHATDGTLQGPAGVVNFIRINTIEAVTSGTYGGNNIDDVDFETSGGTLISQVPAGKGRTEQLVLSVPRNHTLYFAAAFANVDGNKEADISLWRRENADVIAAPFTAAQIIQEWDGLLGPSPVPMYFSDSVPGKSDVYATATTSTTTAVDVEIFYVFIKNPT